MKSGYDLTPYALVAIPFTGLACAVGGWDGIAIVGGGLFALFVAGRIVTQLGRFYSSETPERVEENRSGNRLEG